MHALTHARLIIIGSTIKSYIHQVLRAFQLVRLEEPQKLYTYLRLLEKAECDTSLRCTIAHFKYQINAD